jgi:hypothetical protein
MGAILITDSSMVMIVTTRKTEKIPILRPEAFLCYSA